MSGAGIIRGGPVPVRRQIAARMAADILEGRLRDGLRLPSVRALASRLGVHRHTTAAAYHELETRGLVHRRPGSGVYVRALGWARGARANGGESIGTRNFRAFLGAERRRGRTARDLASGLEEWIRTVSSRRVALVEPDRELLRLLITELRACLPGAEVSGLDIELARTSPRLLRGRMVTARPAWMSEIERLAGPWAEVWAIPAGVAGPSRLAVEGLSTPCTVGIVSRSATVRGWFRELVERTHGDAAGVAAAGPSDRAGVDRALRVSDLLFADPVVVDGLAGAMAHRADAPASRRPIVPIRLVAAAWTAELARYLDCESRSPPATGRVRPRTSARESDESPGRAGAGER